MVGHLVPNLEASQFQNVMYMGFVAVLAAARMLKWQTTMAKCYDIVRGFT